MRLEFIPNTGKRSQYEKLLFMLKPATLALDNFGENDWTNFKFAKRTCLQPGDKLFNIENERFSIRGELRQYVEDVNWENLSLPDGNTVLTAIDSNSDILQVESLFDTVDLHTERNRDHI